MFGGFASGFFRVQSVPLHDPIFQSNDTFSAFGNFVFVRDQYDGSAFVIKSMKQLQDFFRGP
jgi:hypothetical protein